MKTCGEAVLARDHGSRRPGNPRRETTGPRWGAPGLVVDRRDTMTTFGVGLCVLRVYGSTALATLELP